MPAIFYHWPPLDLHIQNCAKLQKDWATHLHNPESFGRQTQGDTVCGSSLTHSSRLADSHVFLALAEGPICSALGQSPLSLWALQFLIANTQWFIIGLQYPRYSPVTLLISANICGNYSTVMKPAYFWCIQLIPEANTLACNPPSITSRLLLQLKDVFVSLASQDVMILTAFPRSPVEWNANASPCQLIGTSWNFFF